MQVFSGYYENCIGNVAKCSIIKRDCSGNYLFFVYLLITRVRCFVNKLYRIIVIKLMMLNDFQINFILASVSVGEKVNV